MTNAIQATFVDLKFIRTRSSVQIILEAPIEQASEITSVLGYPNPSAETWVGVARLNHKTEAPKKIGGKLAQRAGILCNEGGFQKFLQHIRPFDNIETRDEVAFWVRHLCGVESRAELDHDEEAAIKFRDLEISYNAWLAAS